MTTIILISVLSVVILSRSSSQVSPDLTTSAGSDVQHTNSGDGHANTSPGRLRPADLHLHPHASQHEYRTLSIPPVIDNGAEEQRGSYSSVLDLWPLIDLDDAVMRLSRALHFGTISREEGVVEDSSAFLQFHEHLKKCFPRVHETLVLEKVSSLSLLYTWEGSDPDVAPVLLMAHLDVVPAADEHSWTHPPFSGTTADGYIWGRGTLDNKQGVMGILEAVEQLLTDGFAPTRSIYLAFGHDEEVGGHDGAAKVAELLEMRGIRFLTVIDEGGVVLSDFFRRRRRPVAAIGVAEKGNMSFELTVNVQGGHSSMPGGRSAIGTLARAISRVEARPFPAQVNGVSLETLRGLATTQTWTHRLMVSNMWLFRPLVVAALSRRPETNAMIRTTVAPTMLLAGVKANVLPEEASATINFRTMPGDTEESVVAHLRRAINDSHVEIRAIGKPREAPPASPTDTPVYEALSRVIRDVHPEENVLIVPYLVPGGTDSRHFSRIAETTYRFTPIQLSREDTARFHGIDERLPVNEYARLIKSYYRLLQALQ
jgi:carboxypeptidase PM20D1